MPKARAGTLALLSIVAAAPTVCQPLRDVAAARRPMGPAFRTEADLVLISASVMDRDGKFVDGLHSEQVAVFDEKQPVAIRQFGVEDGPVSTLILFDTSGSMKTSDATMRAALKRYVDASMPGDDFCLVRFSDAPDRHCTFTTDGEAVLGRVSGIAPRGGTALLDALLVAMTEVKKGANRRKVILILSDGLDTSSRYNWTELEEHAKETTACLYAVVPKPWQDDSVYLVSRLENIVRLTGGRVFELKSVGDYPEFFTTLDVRRHYVIGFAPPEQAADGKYHHVAIRLSGERKNLRINWKRGYYAPQTTHH